MKFSTFFGTIVEIIIIIGLTNGEVNFCLEFDSTHVSENEGSLEDVPALLKQVGKEIENVIREAEHALGADMTNYTHIPLYITHPAVTLEGDFYNGTTLIDDSTIRLWTFRDEGLEIFNLTFPYIFMNGSYDANGYVGAHRLFDIYGNGDFNFNMTDFSVAAVTGLAINSSELCISLTVKVHLKDFQSYFFNFMNGDVELDPLLNGVLQSITPDAVRIMFSEMVDEVSPYIQAIIDKILHGPMSQSFTRLLYILANHKDELTSIL